MKIMLDAGHGGKDSGAVGSKGTLEKTVALEIVKRVGKILEGKGINVTYTRQGDTFVELDQRVRIANDAKVDYFISVHINSFKDANSNGTETYTYTSPDVKSTELATKVQSELIKAIGLKDRGVKKADFAVLRKTKMSAVLIEVAFISNPKEEELLKDVKFIEKTVNGITKGIFLHLGLSDVENVAYNNLTLIEGAATATKEQMEAYLAKVNPNPKMMCSASELVAYFLEEGNVEGIRGDIAFCQALKETGHFKYGNIVKPEQNNFSGLGALNGNKEGDAATFATPQLGVRAQIQHLKAYANSQSLKGVCVDPRFNLVTRGSAQYTEHLGAADNPKKVGWCYPGEGYGEEILRILSEVLKMEAKAKHWGKESIDKLKAEGLITSDKDPTSNVTWAEFATVINRIIEKQEPTKG